MMNMIDILAETTFKIKTKHFMYYKNLGDNEETRIFSNRGDTFLSAFAIGYHFEGRSETMGAQSIVNISSLDIDARELIVHLICYRYPKLETADEIWKVAEEYAEWGIKVLYDNVTSNGYHLFIEDVLHGESTSEQV